MNYIEFINSILNTRGRFNCGDEYHERHHIVPKCKNGTNDDNNLIDLFAREHFIAHKLLAEENPNDEKLVYAYTLMSFCKDKNQQRYILAPEEYEDARKRYSELVCSDKNPASRRVIRLCDDKIYNTVKDCYIENNVSSNTMWEMLKSHRGFMYYDEYLNMSDMEIQHIKSIDWDAIQHKNRSDAAKRMGKGGSTVCSVETRAKISAAHKGKVGVEVYCPELNEKFVSIVSASEKYNINKVSIGYCLCGKQKHAGKHPVTGEPLSWVKLENKNC